jgi:hypothetical protein
VSKSDFDDRVRELACNPFELELLRRQIAVKEGSGENAETDVDAEGLTASERKACTAIGCAAADFLAAKERYVK